MLAAVNSDRASLTAFFTEQQARIRRISTSYIPRPSQATPQPNRRAVPGTFVYESCDVVDPGAFWHGTDWGYRKKHCHCDPCRRAHNAREAGYRKATREALRHGTTAARRYTDRTPQPSILHASEVS